MVLTFVDDLAVVEWLTRSSTPPWQLITFGPQGFEAYARLRFIPDPTSPDQTEVDAVVGEGSLSDLEQTQLALRALRQFTNSRTSAYFLVWEGTSDIEMLSTSDAFFVDLPHRRYALLHGHLTDIDNWATRLGTSVVTPPAFVWPEDRAWCFTCDVDPHWAGIGASREAVSALINDPILDVVPASPGEAPPSYRC